MYNKTIYLRIFNCYLKMLLSYILYNLEINFYKTNIITIKNKK